MRKYQQLLLIIISVFSLTLLLVYRHEYNRLHYVLEVFNFFGQPCNFSELIESGNILNHHDWGPDPVWNQEGSIYVYSTHLVDQQELQSLVIKQPKLDHPRSCFLWFEESGWKPEVGKLKYTKLFTDREYEGFVYSCSWSRKSTPYAVSYNKNKMYLSKNLVVQNNNLSNKFNITMCVPPTKFLTKRYLVEFLGFHNLLGVDSFIVYSNAIPHKMSKIITNLSKQLNFNVTFYSYNFPQYFEEIIKEDCRLRTLKQTKYAITIEVDEYIVPTNYDLLGSLTSAKSYKIKIPVQKFCINEQLPKKPIALQNLQSIRDDEKLIKLMNVQLNQTKSNTNVISELNINGGLVSIHKYVFCLDKITKTYRDDTILKYSDDFIKSTLFQMNLHDLL